MLAPSASTFRTVSTSDSPLDTLEVAALKLSTSAPSAFAARSNDSRVRVLFSKKRLATTRPASERSGVPARRPRVWRRARPKSSSMSWRDMPSVVSRLRGENGFMA